MIALSADQKNYIYHNLLRHSGMMVSYSYGALLLFEITQSILVVFFLGLIRYTVGFFARSLGIPLFLKIQQRIGGTLIIGFGLGIIATVNIVLFLFQDSLDNLFLLGGLIGLWSIGSGMYWVFNNLIKYHEVSVSKLRGAYASYIISSETLASIVISVVSIYLGLRGDFLFLLILSSLLIISSLYPLSKIVLIGKKKFDFKFSRIFTRVPLLANVANVKVHTALASFAIPLYLLLNFGGLVQSIIITSVAAIVTAIFSRLSGFVKDRGGSFFLIFISIVGVAGYLILPTVSDPYVFSLILSVIGIVGAVVIVGRDANLGKDLTQNSNNFEAIVAVEALRSFGGIIALIILVFVFFALGTIPAWIFILIVIAWLPLIVYSAR